MAPSESRGDAFVLTDRGTAAGIGPRVVDGANVVGSVPDGWWKDRAGAARRLHERLLVADTSYDEIVLVLEGQAKGGVRAGRDAHVTHRCTRHVTATPRSARRPSERPAGERWSPW